MDGRDILTTLINRGAQEYSTFTEEAGKYLLDKGLKNSKLGVIKGLAGVGRWRAAEYAARIAMETHLFDVLIRVKLSRRDWSLRNLQMGIAERLGIQSPMMDGDEVDIDVAYAINAKLKYSRFLLIIGDVSQTIDLGSAGVPILNVTRNRMGRAIVSKIVLIGISTSYNAMPFHWDADFKMPNHRSEGWDLFCEQAFDATHSLSGANGYSFTFSLNTVLDCLMYFSLVDYYVGKEWMIRYWMAEGFIGGEMETGEEEEEEVLAERVEPLLAELIDRSFIDKYFKLLPHVEEAVKERLNHDFKIQKDSLPMDGECRGMSITIEKVISLPPSPKWPNLSTFRLTCPYNAVDLDIPLTFFQHMHDLRVLDLLHTPIISLPSSLSSLCNLRLLRLRGCKKLQALPVSFQALEKLEFLDISGCHSIQNIPEKFFEKMGSLRLLDLSETNIGSLPSSVSNLHNLRQLLLRNCGSLTDIPEKCFEKMQHLRLLVLTYAYSLLSLPSSLLLNLISLKILNLEGCAGLKTGVRPHAWQNLSSLEVLNLDSCSALEEIQDVYFGDVLPNLESVTLANTSTPRRLSFRGCQSLENLNLNYLDNLEVLDLSGTKLKDLNCVGRAHALRRLDMVPIDYTDSCRDFPLEKLLWDDNDAGARIWVREFKFPNWYDYSLFKTKCFSRFHIRISPLEEKRGMPMPVDRIQNIHFLRNQFIYKDIYCHTQTQTHLFLHFRCTYDRHLEILGGNSFPDVGGVLAHTNLLTLFNNRFVEYLDLRSAKNMPELKECLIGSCQRIKTIFSNASSSEVLTQLVVMWVSDLSQLTTLCEGIYDRGESFALLKHIHLERCPKLVTLFGLDYSLNSLETLEIKFCCRLENMFGKEITAGEGALQSLRSLCLWQLPKLKSICSGYLPQVQKVKVGGCRKLRKLPIRVHLIRNAASTSTPPLVEIAGELDWWNNLEWVDEINTIKRPARFTAWRGPFSAKLH